MRIKALNLSRQAHFGDLRIGALKNHRHPLFDPIINQSQNSADGSHYARSTHIPNSHSFGSFSNFGTFSSSVSQFAFFE